MRFRNSLVAGVLLTLLGAASTPAVAQAPPGFPRVIDALKAAPGCLGVETGQIAFIAVVLTVIGFVRRTPLRVPHWAELIPPYAIGSIAMFWVIQRVAAF